MGIHNKSLLLDRDRVQSVSGPDNLSVESIVRIWGVFNGPDGAIGFHQRVLALDHISYTDFLLLLPVPGLVVVNAVVEFILSWRLKKNEIYTIRNGLMGEKRRIITCKSTTACLTPITPAPPSPMPPPSPIPPPIPSPIPPPKPIASPAFAYANAPTNRST